MRVLLPTFSAGLGLPHMLVLAAALFTLGLYGFLTQRHLLRTLMSLELMLAAVALNVAAFSAFLHPAEAQGVWLALVVLGSGAVQVLLGATLALAMIRRGSEADPQAASAVGG